ncbi:MAG: glyceraldehyde 3-phosphate dehydrogenase NAD-binding domain-containing protein [Acidimicrobiia bacterium]|nr:glyceraldehyde 3-phosphate dehydrogenase NAD-binding domain-containing protein [Acidimicrobiia bacterium]
MTTRLGIMGFGRIGRNVFRLLHGRDDMHIVAINDIADREGLTYLLKYDSIYGRFPGDITYADGVCNYDTRKVLFGDARTPADTRWSDAGVDIVLETTSQYRDLDSIRGHLDNGAAKVILTSSPDTPGEIPLLLSGVNNDLLDQEPEVVALGSNTSNAIAPVLKTLHETFGIQNAYLTVVKAMTNTGRLADVPTDSFRTSRAAAENIIPTDTNSAEIITQVLPQLAGKLAVSALMVPVNDGSTVDMVTELEKPATTTEVNSAIRAAAANLYRGILGYVEDPIVSSDVKLDSRSGLFDSLATMVTAETLLKTITWFNNGWGYSHRAVETAERMAAQLEGAAA